MKREVLQAFLQQVRFTGSAKITKRELMWMLGRQNENAGAWSLLLDEWQELSGERESLYVTWHGDHITLLNRAADQLSRSWAVAA